LRPVTAYLGHHQVMSFGGTSTQHFLSLSEFDVPHLVSPSSSALRWHVVLIPPFLRGARETLIFLPPLLCVIQLWLSESNFKAIFFTDLSCFSEVLNKQNSVASLRERTLSTERPLYVGEVSGKLLRIECATWSASPIATAANLAFLGRSRYYFFQVAPQLYSRDWVDPVPDPLFKRSGSAGNITRDLWICSQELWPLDHRGGLLSSIKFSSYLIANTINLRSVARNSDH
jgi:hypothetical protein